MEDEYVQCVQEYEDEENWCADTTLCILDNETQQWPKW